MYEIFEQLLKEKNVTPYQVSKATGVAQSSLSDWKNGKSKPKIDKMQKIADYFSVPVDYLLTGKKNSPEFDSGDEAIFDSDIIRIHRARNKMNDAEREHMMSTLLHIYSKYFNDDYEDNDTEE